MHGVHELATNSITNTCQICSVHLKTSKSRRLVKTWPTHAVTHLWNDKVCTLKNSSIMCWNNKCTMHRCFSDMQAVISTCIARHLLRLCSRLFLCMCVWRDHMPMLASASVSCGTSPHWLVCSHTMCKLTLQFYSQYNAAYKSANEIHFSLSPMAAFVLTNLTYLVIMWVHSVSKKM